MTENYVCYAKAEDELNAIHKVEDWHISNTAPLRFSLQALGKALETLVAHKDVWKGETADAARQRMAEMAERFKVIDAAVGEIVTAVDAANTARKTASGGELPSAQVDPFWANAVKAGATVVHPALGPLAADKALEAIGDWMSGQREAKARETVNAVRTALTTPTTDIMTARAKLQTGSGVDDGGPSGPVDGGSTPGGGTGGQGGPGGYGGPSGAYPSGGYPGGPGGGYAGGGYPGGPGGGNVGPGGPGYPGDPGYPGGPGHPGYPGGPTIDDPHPIGHIPGQGGSGGSGHVPGGGGSLPGGGLIPGAIGGGGAAALAFGARGSLGGLSGAGAGLSGLKPGGLLGGTTGGTGGLLGAGGPGASGSAAQGATGMGARSGGGMIGGQGQGGSDEEKQRRGGSMGPIAPHLEDDEEPIPLPKSGRAGSRGDAGDNRLA
jgi:hypothetical protein